MSPKESLARELARDRAAARAEGRSEGKEEGRVDGQRKILAKLLRLKFGALPAAAEKRLASAQDGQLETWAEAVLTADRIEDVFAAVQRP